MGEIITVLKEGIDATFRWIVLLLILVILSEPVYTQGSINQHLLESFFNNQLIVCRPDGHTIPAKDALHLLLDKTVTSNCWSNYLVYVQLIQKPTTERAIQHPNRLDFADPYRDDIFIAGYVNHTAEGDSEKKARFYYRNEKSPYNFGSILPESLYTIDSCAWVLDQVFLEKTKSQLLDSCHLSYRLQFFPGGRIKQSYAGERMCIHSMTDSEVGTYKVYGEEVRFQRIEHSLYGLHSKCFTRENQVYFLFENGRIEYYEYMIDNSKLVLSNWPTKLVFSKRCIGK